MDGWGVGRRWLHGARLGIGLGFLAGALEVVGLAAMLRLPMSVLDFAALGAVAVGVMGAVGFLMGLASGAALHPVARGLVTSRALALHLGLVGLLLCGWYLWQGAGDLLGEGRPAAAAAMAAMPLGFLGVVYFNAGYWLRKVEIGVEYRLGWNGVALLASGVIVLGTAGAYQAKHTGGTGALEGDASVLLITLDPVRRDHVGVFAEAAPTATPHLDAMAQDSVVYLDAVSPMPLSRAAHATVLTGLHPLRHGVVTEHAELGRGYRTLAEALRKEHYATAAFVSSGAVDASSGLSQGFLVFDDDLVGWPPGVLRIDVVDLLHRTVGLSSSVQRDPEVTVARFQTWFARHQSLPYFAWIHLGLDTGDAAPDDPTEAYRAGVERLDQLIGVILAEVDERTDHTLVVVTSPHGWMLGEHELGHGTDGLYDEVVRVPLLVRAPGLRPRTTRIDPQVRLMDVAPTALEFLGIDALEGAEGVELLGYPRGVRSRTIWSSLVDARAEHIGLRNNGIKFVRHLASGEELLFDLASDPTESRSLVDEQPQTLEQARELVRGEAGMLHGLVGGEPAPWP